MIPLQAFVLEKNEGKNNENDERDHFLDHFELYQAERTTAFLVSKPVCGHHQCVFKEGNPPADQHNGNNTKIFGPSHFFEFEMPVPGEGHKSIGKDQQDDGGKASHKISGLEFLDQNFFPKNKIKFSKRKGKQVKYYEHFDK